MGDEKRNDICKPGIDCSYTVRRDKIVCNHKGSPDYLLAELLEADTSAFHTDQMAEATRAINKILSEIPKDDEGLVPAFIQTRMGMMLAWVTREDETVRAADKFAETDEIGVTSADDNETLAKALKLKSRQPQ